MRINVAGLQIDNLTKAEVLARIEQFVRSGRPHYMVTAYSEFAVMAAKNARYHAALNNADLAVPDGIGILWAAKFQSLHANNFVTIIWVWLKTLAQIVLSPQSLRTVIKEQVSGSRLVWDIAQLSEEKGFRIALVGGHNNVAHDAAQKLAERFPRLQITMAVSDQPFDQNMVSQISASNSDILLIAYQPPKQELWLAENIDQLNVKFAVGLGGTFDYLAGKRAMAPSWVHYIGLEWLWRLVTQPWRAKRMWRAIVQFSFLTLKMRLQKNERTN
jgi:N-acetylglucosaminyldiphosphoundecaprenol N-acetyl-beta-D-mannosaminyltransferase